MKCLNKLIPLLFSSLILLKPILSEEVWVYFDAHRSRHKSSALAIERGFLTALSEIDSRIGDRVIKLKKLDHRGNSVRSRNHMERFLEDEKALFILGGLHSPPLIKYRSWINDNKIPILVPWAAGGPITRHPSSDNWIFRCSVDDSKAGKVMANYALSKGMKKPALVMEDTPWGKGNQKNVSKALKEVLGSIPTTVWFNWNTKEEGARIKLRDLLRKGHDGIILVGNAGESLAFCKAMASLENRIPIVSHWGITGGNFEEELGTEFLEKIDLSFIQTRFSFVSSKGHDLSRSVWDRAKNLFPEELKVHRDLKSPTGFIHAYDLAKLAISAMKKMEWSETPKMSRDGLRKSLESLSEPVTGLIKVYEKPFGPWSKDNIDAHEALGEKDLAFGRFRLDGAIELVKAN